MFVLRHKGTMKGGSEELRHIANVIFLNMVCSLPIVYTNCCLFFLQYYKVKFLTL